VLADAIVLAHGVVAGSPATVRAARYWITAGDVGRLTFDQICFVLEWDAPAVRRVILHRSERRSAAASNDHEEVPTRRA
jgi:hypothetical protein